MGTGGGGPFPGAKARPGRDADHSPPSSASMSSSLSVWVGVVAKSPQPQTMLHSRSASVARFYGHCHSHAPLTSLNQLGLEIWCAWRHVIVCKHLCGGYRLPQGCTRLVPRVSFPVHVCPNKKVGSFFVCTTDELSCISYTFNPVKPSGNCMPQRLFS
jgi:hypothetical protein